MTIRGYIRAVATAALLLAMSPWAWAHAVLVRSAPADRSIVHSADVHLVLDYNSRIDASRCNLTLVGPGGKTFTLDREPAENPGELKATAHNLPSGNYQIHWQVLASDGHITRGEVTFTVALK
ncbi:MAG: copper resistance CopC family protein [Acidobacteriaceae bacterium]